MMTDPSYAQRVAVRSIQTLFCYARGTEGATRAAAGANASAMRSLFILAVLWSRPNARHVEMRPRRQQSNLETPSKRHDSHLESIFRLPGVLLWPNSVRNRGGAPPRPSLAVLIANPTPSPRDLHTTGPGTPETKNPRDNLRAPRPPPSPKTTARPRPPTAPRPPGRPAPGRRSRACPPSAPKSP